MLIGPLVERCSLPLVCLSVSAGDISRKTSSPSGGFSAHNCSKASLSLGVADGREGACNCTAPSLQTFSSSFAG